jgi:Glutamate-cysteine ligase family 2(GCS2)
MADPARLRFGIEAEYALVHAERGFCDFTALSYAEAQRIVDRLPDHHDADLTRGDLEVKLTRWYVEGDERFDPSGGFLRCVPKGLETRTPIRPSIAAAVAQLHEQTAQLAAAARPDGFRLATVGRNPWRDYRPQPPYNRWETALHERKPEYAAPEAYMVGYGPDLNLSHPDWPPERVLDVGRKLTALSPGLVPFSFSSPFAGGAVVALSTRTLLRAPLRPSARAFLPVARGPVGVAARIPAEVGRIEFKAFDALAPDLYAPLLALLAGLALDGTIGARADRPDPAAHARAATLGFDDPDTRRVAEHALDAADRALAGTLDGGVLEPLRAMLARRRTPAHDLIETFRRTGEIPLPEPSPEREAR